MIDFDSRTRDAELLALKGQRAAAIAAYEGIVADIEAGKRYYGEGDVRSGFARLLHETADPREVGQLTKAVAAFQRQKNLPGLIDACLRLVDLNRHSETTARYWVDRAVAAAESGADPHDLCRVLGARGQVLLATDHAEEAVATLQKVLALPGGDAYTGDLASAQIAAGRPREGIALLERALAAAASDSGADTPQRVTLLRMRLADGKLAAGDRDGAIALLRQTQPMAAGLENGTLHALLMDRLGAALLEAGDAAGAANTLERGIERMRREERANDRALASLYNNLGNALATIGHDTGAVQAFSAATGLMRGVNLRSEALAFFGLANSAARLGATADARDAYDEARALAVRLGDAGLEAACLDSLGQLAAAEGDPARAVDLQKRAIDLHRMAADARGEHTDLMNLIQSLLLLGETAAARRALEEARGAAQRLGPQLPWQHLLVEGRVLAAERDWAQARLSFDAALERLECERASMQSPADQRRWAARRVEAFEIATRAAFDARDALAALTYLEGNRARFFEAVSERRRRLPAALPADLRKAYLAAADRVAEERARRRERPDRVYPAADAEYDAADRVFLALSAQVEQTRAGDALAPEPAPPLEQLADSLTAGEVAVALHATIEFVGVACIGRARDGTTWWACDSDPRLTLAFLSRAVVGRAEGDAQTSHPAWLDLGNLPLGEAQQLVAATIAWLGERLWPVIERVLGDRADALVLMPGRGLNVLPLHAAATSDGRLAMQRWSVRYAPSLRLLARAGRPGVLPADRVLGQAVDPTANLPFAQAEATAVRQHWKGRRAFPLRGPQAQPERVLPLFETTDVLHFAGHATFDPEDPLRSRLLCAPGKAADAITLHTLLESVPVARTRVVLLSACETGRVEAGDILNDQLGLPGGLLVAGSSAILATFWKVDDLAASLILSRCIEAWERGSIDLERAVAEAQAWLREKATAGVVRAWIRKQLETQEGSDPQLELAHDHLVARNQDELIFADALYWAPFHVTGRSVRVR